MPKPSIRTFSDGQRPRCAQAYALALIGRDGKIGRSVAFFGYAVGLCPRVPTEQDQDGQDGSISDELHDKRTQSAHHSFPAELRECSDDLRHLFLPETPQYCEV
jgi:hypothetical protein